MLLSMLTIAKRLVTNLAPVNDVIEALGLLLGELIGMAAVNFLGGTIINAVRLFWVGVVVVAHGEDDHKQEQTYKPYDHSR